MEPDEIVKISDVKEHPAFPFPVYATKSVYQRCVNAPESEQWLKRRDSLLTTIAAAVSHAISATKGEEIHSVGFVHKVKYGKARSQSKNVELQVFPSTNAATAEPYLLVCEPGWLPNDGKVMH